MTYPAVITDNSLCTEFEEGIHQQYKDYFSLSNWKNAKNDFARVNVYFADNNMVVTEEVADYEPAQLIADIGGQLGVWVGVSVITLCETLALFFQLMRYFCCKLVHRRRGTLDDPPAAV